MAKTYKTISGDTWDLISYKVYGEERYYQKIMEANMDMLEYFVFPAGVELQIPDVETVKETSNTVPSDYPVWRQELNG